MRYAHTRLHRESHRLCVCVTATVQQWIHGSTTALVALHREMLELGKVAICRAVLRRNSQPRFVALVAQEEVMDTDGTVLVPNGFHCVPIPFRDEIRDLNFEGVAFRLVATECAA